jgi:Transposase and inactivated derivatives
MRHLNEVQLARAVSLIQEGLTFRRVAVDLNVSPSVIRRLWNRYDETGQFTRRVGQGRGCMTTPQDDDHLCVAA